MKTIILAVLLLASSSVFSADEWRTSDTYRETAFQVLNIIDWGQTRYIAEHPDDFHERDSQQFIGLHPTSGRTDAFMAEIAVLHYAISRTLIYLDMPDWCAAFQYVTIGAKFNTTVNNASIGIKVSF